LIFMVAFPIARPPILLPWETFFVCLKLSLSFSTDLSCH